MFISGARIGVTLGIRRLARICLGQRGFQCLAPRSQRHGTHRHAIGTHEYAAGLHTLLFLLFRGFLRQFSGQAFFFARLFAVGFFLCFSHVLLSLFLVGRHPNRCAHGLNLHLCSMGDDGD